MFANQIHEALVTPPVQKFLRRKARRLQHRREFRGVDFPDILQELTVRILSRAHRFDPARGSAAMFISMVVRSISASFCRERQYLKRGVALRVQSLDVPVPGDDHDDPLPQTLGDLLTEADGGRAAGIVATAPSDRWEMRRDFHAVLASLTPAQRKVAAALMRSGGETSLSQDMGISRRQVRAVISTVRIRFSAAGYVFSRARVKNEKK